jgi:hypothetical protein
MTTATQTDLDEWHDAVLETVTFDWAGAKATVSLRLSATPRTRCLVTIEKVTLVHCPRENSWGPSKSVNEANLENDGKRVVIQMQSGDDLVFEGANVSVAISPI